MSRQLLALAIVTRALETEAARRDRGPIGRSISGLVSIATPTVLDIIDLDAVIERLDVNEIADRLDLDALLQRIDVNEMADRLDLDALIERVDIAPLVGRGSAGVAESGLDLVRRQLIRFDVLINALIMRLTRRDPAVVPLGPGPDRSANGPEPAVAMSVEGRDVQGRYAGPVSRLVAAVLDVFGAVTTFGLLGSVTAFFVSFVTFDEFGWEDDGGPLRLVLLFGWLFAWYWVSQATTGRTPGKTMVGLRAVRREGGTLGPRRALVRVLVLPISWVLAGLGFVGIAVGRERRALHDVVAGSVVVYDWGDRRAELPRMRLVAARRAGAPSDAAD